MGGLSDPQRARRALHSEQGGRCAYCLRPMRLRGVDFPRDAAPVPDEATVDHVTARSRGGRNYRPNLVAACRVCNEGKADAPPETFLATILPPETVSAVLASQEGIAVTLRRRAGACG